MMHGCTIFDMQNAAACHQTDRLIHDMIDSLVEARLVRLPGADEAEIRSEVWEALRQHADLDDPNNLNQASSAAVVWVLTALLEMEPDQVCRGKVA